MAANVHHVDDPSADLFEVDLTESALLSLLRCGDRLAEGDRGLREELLAVVERTWLDGVTVVPDQPAAPASAKVAPTRTSASTALRAMSSRFIRLPPSHSGSGTGAT